MQNNGNSGKRFRVYNMSPVRHSDKNMLLVQVERYMWNVSCDQKGLNVSYFLCIFLRLGKMPEFVCHPEA